MKHVVDLTKKLICIKSTKDNPSGIEDALSVIKQELNGTNYKTFKKNKSRSFLFYNTKKIPEKFDVILNGHIDVVPGKNFQYRPKISSGKLYGRGAQDMKGAVAAMSLVFKEVANKTNLKIGLQIVSDEEIGGFLGTKHQLNKGIRADFAIAGEPTDLGVNNKSKGVMWLRIKTKGKSAHAAYHWESQNALMETKRIIDRLEAEFPMAKEGAWVSTVNPTMIETTNKTYNMIADDCTLSLDVRYTQEEEENVLERINKILPENSEMKVIMSESTHFTDDKNKYVEMLQTAGQKVIGKKLDLIAKHGGSDMRYFNELGIPSITFGTIGGGIHSDSEWVDVKSLSSYYEILRLFLLESSNKS